MAAMPMSLIEVHRTGPDLAQRTVCVKVRLGRLGNTRKVSNSQVEVDTDKSLIRVSKHLLDSTELRTLGNFDGEIRRYLYDTCLPFEAGIHLCPLPLLEPMEAKLREFSGRRDALVQTFLGAYPALCQSAAARLRSLYNPADYPPCQYVQQQFTFTWQYISFGVPEQLREISTKIWHDEREKAAVMMAEAGREIQQVLRAAMAELVKHMRDRLKDGPDGKPLRFKESTVSNLVEFLGTFDFRNVADDAELKELVDKARDMLTGVSAEDLRTTAGVRAKVQNGMADLAAELDTMIVKKPGRKFRFQEE
ncbi:MAG: hypothetical protein K2X03_02390 [Bryobacteraceae bacterium]|nr:hypothetical protein [Bryobacteraceae bacterium]